MGRHVEIEWQESEVELKQLYLQEKNPERKTRLHALWLMRQGKTMTEVSGLIGVHYRTVQRWAARYRVGGRAEVLKRIPGYAATGRKYYLTPSQRQALLAQVARGVFHSIWEVLDFVEQRWGVRYQPGGMYDFLARHNANLKVPRPQAAQTSPEVQEQWKKGGSSQP
jgi:transposase